MTKDQELNASFESIFCSKITCPQEQVRAGRQGQNETAIIQEMASNLLDIHTSMVPDGIHPRVLRELLEELTESFSIIHHLSWLTREASVD